MKRLHVSSLVFAVPALGAFGVFVFGSSAPEANLYWTHPYGHSTGAPCAHRQHPSGDPVPALACNCPLLPEHPAGHPTTAPCAHKKLRHPAGHDTGKKDPFGKPIMSPCTEWDTEHPNGHPGPNGPCGHLTRKAHPNGHPLPNKPCNHVQHPEGHGVPTPCNHLLPLDPKPNSLGLKYYTTDESIQLAVNAAANKLRVAGVRVGEPRKLSVFYREPINGDPNDNSDPFWSHYNPIWHSIQLTKGRPIADLAQTARHELGHAMLGHKFTHIPSKGGEHTISDAKDEALAMSEGWANFVALFLTGSANDYKGFDWDKAHLNTDIPFSTKNEFRVAAILWDLIDPSADTKARGGKGPTPPGLKFDDLFKVYSPTLATLANGPIIPSIDDFLARIKKNNPAKAHLIDPIRNFNLTPP